MIKYCCSCNAVIVNLSRQWADQKYCSTRCRKSSYRKKKTTLSRIDRRKANLLQNDEVLYLLSQCRRGGTVQVLHGHNLDSFTKTMDLIKNRPLGDIHLCHIFPVKGKVAIGLLHYLNLFYAGAHQNRLFGNAHFAGGLSIDTSDLAEQWTVRPSMSNNDILLLIEEYLQDIIPMYIERNPVLKSRKANLIENISALDCSTSQEKLYQYSYSKLDAIWSKISHAQSKLPKLKNESKYIVYMDSLSRLISYNTKNKKTLVAVRLLMAIVYRALNKEQKSKTYNKWFNVCYCYLIPTRYGNVKLRDSENWSALKDMMYNTAFAALQGKVIDMEKFRKKVWEYISLQG